MKDIVCNCQMVERETINRAIHKKGAKTIEDIRRYTGANTGCGKCMGYINAILSEEVPKVEKPQKQNRFKLW